MKTQSLVALSILIAGQSATASDSRSFIESENELAKTLVESGKLLNEGLKANNKRSALYRFLEKANEKRKILVSWLVNSKESKPEDVAEVLEELYERYEDSDLSLKDILEKELSLNKTFLDASAFEEALTLVPQPSVNPTFVRSAKVTYYDEAEPKQTFVDRETSFADAFQDAKLGEGELPATFTWIRHSNDGDERLGHTFGL